LPLRAADGALQAVVIADFDLSALSRFLDNLDGGEKGCAVLLEWQDDRQVHVVGHPDAHLLFINHDNKPGHEKLSPTSQFADARVQAFLKQLSTDLPLEKYPPYGMVQFVADGENYLGSYQKLTQRLEPSWLICSFIPEDEIMADANRAIQLTTIMTL